MLEKCTTEGINIRPWIFDLSNCPENARNRIKAFPCKVADIVVFDVGISKFLQMQEARISVPQNSMSISRNDFSLAERLPHVFLDDLLAWFFPFVIRLEFGQPLEAFLVGKSMQRTSKAIHRC